MVIPQPVSKAAGNLIKATDTLNFRRPLVAAKDHCLPRGIQNEVTAKLACAALNAPNERWGGGVDSVPLPNSQSSGRSETG